MKPAEATKCKIDLLVGLVRAASPYLTLPCLALPCLALPTCMIVQVRTMHWYNHFIPGVTRPIGFLLAPSEATNCEQDFCSRSRLFATCEDPVERPLYPPGSLLEALLLRGLASGLSTGQWVKFRVPIGVLLSFGVRGVLFTSR